jgi:hypothetical protein
VNSLGDAGVGVTANHGDLRFCLSQANARPGEDLIVFSVTGAINLTQALPDISDDLIIAGPGADRLTVRRVGGGYRILTIDAGVTALVGGVTLTNGYSVSGGGVYNAGVLTLRSVAVTANANPMCDGGGITNAGTLRLEHATVAGNTASGPGGEGGGGILNLAGATTAVVGSTVSHNMVSAGGTDYGGGIYNLGSMVIDHSAVAGNLVRASSVANQPAYAYGGGIANLGSMSILAGAVNRNQADGGLNNIIHQQGDGGGIYTTGLLTLDGSTVSGNLVGPNNHNSGGGGVYSAGRATLITNSTIAGNELNTHSQGLGGGIYYFATSASVRHSTIAANVALSEGSAYGGGMASSVSQVSVWDTVVAGNQGVTGPDLYGALASSGYNLFGKSAGGSGYAPSDLLDMNALLGPLQDNGGPTLTMALLPGSPAIDSGDNANAPEWDQRGPGYPRIVNGTIDRGAFEVQKTVPGTEGAGLDLSALRVMHLVRVTDPKPAAPGAAPYPRPQAELAIGAALRGAPAAPACWHVSVPAADAGVGWLWLIDGL